MSKRLRTFLITEILSRTYGLDSGNNIHSESHALVDTTTNIRKTLDDGNIDCGVFRLTRSFLYCRPPDTVSKIESLWDLWSFK